jgi:DNA-binding NtrC family response regulator
VAYTQNQRVGQQVGFFIGQTPVAQEIQRFTELAAQSHFTVLLRGETGVGKDLMIHQRSKPGRALTYVDCGALPPSLSETELFGHAPGAFTDAKAQKLGLLQVAQDGSIFFNEIANMGLDVQSKFLSVLERRSFRPVGAVREVDVTARFIAASNADLEIEVRQGRFRADLFHRLNVLSYEIPPLRARRDDIPLIVNHILESDKLQRTISSEALNVLMEYSWPGNVRELFAVIRRGAFLARESEIGIDEVAPHLKGVGEAVFPTHFEMERRYFRELVSYCKGNISAVADVSALERSALHRKLKDLSLLDFVEEVRGQRMH